MPPNVTTGARYPSGWLRRTGDAGADCCHDPRVKFVAWLLSNAAALAVAAWLLPGVSFTRMREPVSAELGAKIIPLLFVTLILGTVSAVVEPVVKFLSLPFIIVTIGLFLVVINAAMLLLTEWIAHRFDLGFFIDGFWWAVAGAIIITLVTGFVDLVVIDDD